jgi:hypothetical protein
MGTRIRLGKGFTIGRSGLRYGRPIPGIPRSYISTGRSGTLLVGGHLRHWEPARRGGHGTQRHGGDGPVRRTPAQWAAIRRTTDDLRAGVAHLEDLQAWARDLLAGTAPEVVAEMARTPEGREALAHADGTHPAYIAARDQLAASEVILADAPAGASGGGWTRHGFYALLLLVLFIGGPTWAAYSQQAGTFAQDRAEGLTAARAAGAPGICLYDRVWDGHRHWTVSKDGRCDPSAAFVPAN